MTDEELHQRIDELWEWACAVLPVFGDELRTTWMNTPYVSWMNTPYVFSKGDKAMTNKEAAKHLLEILANPEHEHRLTLAMDAYFYGGSSTRFENTPKKEMDFKQYIQEKWNAFNKGE